MEFSEAMDLLAKGVKAVGTLTTAWGMVQLGSSIKDSNGPSIQQAIFQIAGGAIIIAAGFAIAKVTM